MYIVLAVMLNLPMMRPRKVPKSNIRKVLLSTESIENQTTKEN